MRRGLHAAMRSPWRLAFFSTKTIVNHLAMDSLLVCKALLALHFSNTPMPHLSRLTLVLAITVLFTGCAAGLADLPWNNTETTTTSKKVPPPNNQAGRWGTLETTTTCVNSYIGSTLQSRNCSVAEKYIPPPVKTFSGGLFERVAKSFLDDLVGGAVDATLDRLSRPETPPASDTPSNMTVLPPAEATSAPSAAPASAVQSADNAPAQTP